MSDFHRGRRYLLLETQDFSRDPEGSTPATSFLRLGGVQNLAHVRDADTMRRLSPQAGATTAAAGAGEDLAAKVHAFTDDDRDRCDPPHLDEDVAAAGAAARSERLRAEERKLEERRLNLASIDHVVSKVLHDPTGWLRDLFDRWRVAEARVTRLQKAYDDALATAAAEAPVVEAHVGPPGFCPGYVPIADRKAETAKLHTRGGWRDHTDGNRIVTTRGDKVEVIRGNYRLVVLGRYDDPRDAEGRSILPGWDASGGHIDETSLVVAQKTEIAWKRRHGGTWHTLETTTKSDTHVVSTGDSESHFFGHHRRTQVGSEHPTGAWHEPEDCAGGCRGNPKVLSRVWASDLDSQTGSEACRVPVIEDITWATTLRAETHAHDLVDRIWADTMAMKSNIAGAMRMTTKADTMSTLIEADTFDITTTSALTLALTMGNVDNYQLGACTNVTVGTSSDLMLGAQTNLTAGATVDLTLGASADVCVGARATLSIGGTLSLQAGAVSDNSSAANLELALLTRSKLAPVVVFQGLNITMG